MSRWGRAAAVVAVGVVALATLTACHKPQPSITGLIQPAGVKDPVTNAARSQQLDWTMGEFPGVDPTTRPYLYMIFTSQTDGLDSCWLDYYYREPTANSLVLIGSDDVDPMSTVVSTWPTRVVVPGEYQVFASCGGLASAQPITVRIAKKSQTVTWNPTTAITSTTAAAAGGREFTPSAWATTSGDGAITYAVTGDTNGATGCSLRTTQSGTVIAVGGNGTCTVTATAAETPQYAAGSTTVTFTISNYVDPNATTTSTGGGSSCPSGIYGDGGICLPVHVG